MKKRSFSIRTRILILLLAPLLPLVGIWIFSTSSSITSAMNLLDAKTNSDDAGQPANIVVTALQTERKMSIAFVSDGSPAPLNVQRSQTDKAIAEFKRLAGGDRLQGTATDLTKYHIEKLIEYLDKIEVGRDAIDSRQYGRVDVMLFYNQMIDQAFAMYSSIGGVDNQVLARQAATIIAVTEARDMLNREDALVSGVLSSGAVSVPELVQLVQTIGINRYLLQTSTRNLEPQDQMTYQKLVNGDSYLKLHAMEDKIINEASPNRPLPLDGPLWTSTFTDVNEGLRVLADDAATRTISSATPLAVNTLLRLGIVGVLGLILIIALIIVSARIARALIRRITDVREHALDLASVRLPDAVARLRHGEQVEVPEVKEVDTDELGQLTYAFNAVQRTAIESAVQEAALRNGLNQVFLNIGRRSQTLVHRQLSLLERMEQRVSDPRELEEVYRVDHLAVRMRRYAEDLVILAGAVPGRGWRNPVPLADVLRSAMSEVEDYTRIHVASVNSVRLAGRAVSDVIHLLAELLENATVFSPKETQVRVISQMLPNGFAVEIEDRGVGLPPDVLAEANERLANPPDFDPARSSRLGLFVVARLAARHGIKVTLQPSAFGGITAITLLPKEIVVEEGLGAGVPQFGTSDWDALQQPTVDLPVLTAMAASFSAPSLPYRPVEPAAPAPEEIEGLPVRTKQANMVPQLRQTPPLLDQMPVSAPPAATGTPSGMDLPRPAEQSRSLLSALQAGVASGRRAAADPPSESDVSAENTDEEELR